MNLIPKIAEMLGTKMNEVFRIKGHDNVIYKFCGTGLYGKKVDDTGIWVVILGTTFRNLLVGVLEIEMLPFEPKDEEKYYYVSDIFGNFVIAESIWRDSLCDYKQKFCGNVFRTKAEAEAHKYEIYEKLSGKKWGE